ncbi:MAG TPA: phosphatase PAP2 family protein [Caulobacteraceae bacterium]|nr:phosphatase PAP2 family protein [Caulobacteraceae bacterium]
MRMMMFGAAFGVAAVTCGIVMAQAPAPEAAKPAAPKPERPKGYLPDGAVNASAFLPPVPAAGSPAEAADVAAYKEALKEVDTPRWKQAAADDDFSPPAVLKHYQCALGFKVDPAKAPALTRVLGRTGIDANTTVSRAKAHFKRQRPFHGDATTPLCLDIPADVRAKASTAYPSGHSAGGFLWGLILSELAPDRTDAVMARARDLSHSRLVCRLHYPSDLEAGHMTAAALYARLNAEPEFRADVDKARAELAAARAAAVKPEACAA